MLERIKLLLNRLNDDDDELLALLMQMCREEATNYCNLEEYSTDLDSIVIEMVIERYNRIGSEALTSQSTSGVSASYFDGVYSDKVYTMLKKHRRLRTL